MLYRVFYVIIYEDNYSFGSFHWNLYLKSQTFFHKGGKHHTTDTLCSRSVNTSQSITCCSRSVNIAQSTSFIKPLSDTFVYWCWAGTAEKVIKRVKAFWKVILVSSLQIYFYPLFFEIWVDLFYCLEKFNTCFNNKMFDLFTIYTKKVQPTILILEGYD